MFNSIKNLFNKETVQPQQPVEQKEEVKQEEPKKLFEVVKDQYGYTKDILWRYLYSDSLKKYLTFTDKASYFQWIAEWKEEYTKVAAELRALRLDLSKPHQVKEVKASWGSYFISDASSAQSRQAMLRVFATNLLIIRIWSKKEAGRQMKERLANK